MSCERRSLYTPTTPPYATTPPSHHPTIPPPRHHATTPPESAYRNSATAVKSLLEKNHSGHYHVFNLCSEATHQYDGAFFDGRVSCYPFPGKHLERRSGWAREHAGGQAVGWIVG